MTDSPTAPGFRRLSHALLLALCVLLLLLAAVISRQMTPHSGDALNATLTPVQERAIENLFDLSKLLISWSLGLVGGSVFILKLTRESGSPTLTSQLFLVELSALLALTSVLLGCQVISNSILALQVDQSPVGNPIVDPYLRWQYRTLVAGAVLLVVAAHGAAWPAVLHGVVPERVGKTLG